MADVRSRSKSEVIYPSDDLSEPCLEPSTIRWLDDIAQRAERDDLECLRSVGRVFELITP